MSAKVSNDFSPPIRKDSCRLSSCVIVCLHCVIANRRSVLSCRRLPTRLMIASHSCAWQRLSQHSLLACAARRKRLVSLNARKSCDSWLKTSWLARISSPFVTAFRSLQVCPKTEDPTAQTAKITFCVSGVISPVLSNLYLNEVDRMLERAQKVTRYKQYTAIQYARFADDLVILVESHKRHDWLIAAVTKRLREELGKLRVQVNEEKSRIVDLRKGESFSFLGFDYRLVRSLTGRWRPQYTPKVKKRTVLLEKLREIFRRKASQPVSEVIKLINPILRGGVNYFAVGHSSRCFAVIQDWVEKKIR